MRRWFRRHVLSRRWATFVVLVLAFLGFGCATANIFLLLHANLELLATHGLMALMDGGLRQLLEILANAAVGMACYLLFKACEYRMVQWLAAKDPADP